MIVTAHPLQRIGAYALAYIADMERSVDGAWPLPDPSQLGEAGFEAAVAVMTRDAVRAALVRDTKVARGFFLKCSLSLFPNSPMAHPSNARRSDEEIAERVRLWRSPPAEGGTKSTSEAPCVLCSQPSVGFFGKLDIPLAESEAYRNTTPRGHEGMALCWSCVCCFRAAPYGSWLTGGPSLALHSWDDQFMASAIATQVRVTRQVIEMGADRQTSLAAREALALRALRAYQHELTSGVELLVYSNNNRGPTLEVYGLDRPLAEWLRRTMRPSRRRAFRALLAAHRTAKVPGHVGLARSAFRAPERIPGACARWLWAALTRSGTDQDGTEQALALAELCYDYADKVMRMDKDNLEEIRATGRRVATIINAAPNAGKLTEFYSLFKSQSRLLSWLQRQSVEWVRHRRDSQDGPLLTTNGLGLLFDPDFENPAWFHRQMLLAAVTEELFRLGWRPEDGAGSEIEALWDVDELDVEFVGAAGGEDEQ